MYTKLLLIKGEKSDNLRMTFLVLPKSMWANEKGSQLIEEEIPKVIGNTSHEGNYCTTR